MKLVQVNIIGVQVFEAGFQVGAHVVGHIALLFSFAVKGDFFVSGIDIVTKLGGDDHLVAAAFDSLP